MLGHARRGGGGGLSRRQTAGTGSWLWRGLVDVTARNKQRNVRNSEGGRAEAGTTRRGKEDERGGERGEGRERRRER